MIFAIINNFLAAFNSFNSLQHNPWNDLNDSIGSTLEPSVEVSELPPLLQVSESANPVFRNTNTYSRYDIPVSGTGNPPLSLSSETGNGNIDLSQISSDDSLNEEYLISAAEKYSFGRL